MRRGPIPIAALMTQVATPSPAPLLSPSRNEPPTSGSQNKTVENCELTAADAAFYLTADAFFKANQPAALTYDDVSLATLYSEILPREADTATSLSDALRLPIPIISSDMDTVTESRMAIAMALNGGLGLIHYNMPPKEQVKEVARVKRHIHGLIQDPITVAPTDTIGDVLAMIEERKFTFSTFPVVTADRQLAGLLSGHVVKDRYRAKTVATVMTPRSALITTPEEKVAHDPIAAANLFFNTHVGINKMLVVNAHDQLRGLVTSSDVDKITSEAKARRKPARDAQFRLVVGAAVSPQRKLDGSLDRDAVLEHIGNLAAEGIDAVALSSAHAHTVSLGELVRLVRAAFPELTIIAGNVTSGAGVEFLARAGASAIKIGQGPGSICTTRVVAGVGIPQLTALHLAAQSARKLGVRLIADGGITKSGDIVKALTLADAVILGGLLAGCREAPGEIMEIGGKLYKSYRGMGSLAAMKSGSAARYGHDKNDTVRKLTAEGIEALKEVSGSVDDTLATLIGGVQSGMGYLGAATLESLRARARYVRVSPAGQKEAAPHDVVEVSTRSN